MKRDLHWVLVSSTFRLLTGVSSSEVMSSSVIVFFWSLAMMALSLAFLISSSSYVAFDMVDSSGS